MTWLAVQLTRLLMALFGSKQRQEAVLPPQPPVEPIDEPEPIKTALDPDSYLFPWDGQQHNWHNVRVLCDRAGLSLEQKNIISACIYQESEFFNFLPSGLPVKHENLNKNGSISSTDWGICEVNDFFHIGPGKDFPSVEYVLSRPEMAVAWMIQCFKRGQLGLWSSYKTGVYKQWLSTTSKMWALAHGVS